MEQIFKVPIERKEKYGEVTTDFKLINKMLDMLPSEVWINKKYRWLDVGCGQGYYSFVILERLKKGLIDQFKNEEECIMHIKTKMLYMIEINNYHKEHLINTFGEEANVVIGDFMTIDVLKKMNIIVGNPPYNINGSIKTPTNNNQNKKLEGKVVWRLFLLKSLSLLKKGGILSFIIPSIWFRIDKSKTHEYIFNNYKLLKSVCYSSSETKSLFRSNAQTPTVMFTLENSKPAKKMKSLFYDNNHYIEYQYCVKEPLPLKNYALLDKARHYVQKYGYVKVIKTNCLPSRIKVSRVKTDECKYRCVRTRLTGNDVVYEYTNELTKHHNDKKIIMANKMYGKPMIDFNGELGLSTRDNYLIVDKRPMEMMILKRYLETDFVLNVFDSFRYRMRYLEKEAFLFIPDVLQYMRINKGSNIFNLLNELKL